MNRINGITCILLLILCACSESKKKLPSIDASRQAYRLKEAVPPQAIPGSIVTLYGEIMPDSAVDVSFNDVKVDSVLEYGENYLVVKLPVLREKGEVNVQVTSHDGQWLSNYISFNVLEMPEKIPTVYWTTHKLYRGGVKDGNVYEELLFKEKNPRGMYIDHKEGMIYWGNSFGFIHKGNLETKKDTVISNVGLDLLDMTMDDKKEWIYYSKDSVIKRVSLIDSSKTEVLFTGLTVPKHLLVSGNDLFWSETEAVKLMKGSINGGKPTVVLDSLSGITGPRGFDVWNDKIYFSDVARYGQCTIYEYDMKTGGLKKLWMTKRDGIGEMIYEVSIDKETGYLYWLNSKGRNRQNRHDGALWRGPIDKSADPEVIFQTINYGYMVSL